MSPKEKMLASFWAQLRANPNRQFSHMPLTWRITGWFLLFLFLMLVSLATFVIQFINLWEESQLHADLQQVVTRTATNPLMLSQVTNGIYTALYAPSGLITRGAVPEGFPGNAPASLNQVTEVEIGKQLFYYYDVPYQTDVFSGWVRGVVPANLLSRRLNIVVIGFLTGGMALIFIAIFGGYWLIRRGLRPIFIMAETAESIGQSGDLSKRIPIGSGDDELTKLAKTFNTMLDSLENTAKREKQFSSDVSHELRTPITVIQAESDFAMRYVSTLEEAKECFQHINKQSKFMSTMVTQLMEITRLDKLTEIKRQRVELSTMLQDIMRDYERLLDATGITLMGHIQSDVVLAADPTLLHRAITNLIDNARKFTHTEITVTLAESPSGIVTLSVRDNGHGIAPEDLPRIWDRLFQTESSRNRSNNKGVGLGLYFVRNVIALHQGETLVESTLDESTTFTIVLPPSPLTDAKL